MVSMVCYMISHDRLIRISSLKYQLMESCNKLLVSTIMTFFMKLTKHVKNNEVISNNKLSPKENGMNSNLGWEF